MEPVVVETQADWLTPVATLVAVLIGGGVTWLVQWLHARRAEQGQLKASARVVHGDLAAQASRLKDMVVDDHRWYGFQDLRMPNWERHAAVLALHLAPEAWEDLSQSAVELSAITDGMERALSPGGPHEGARVVPLSPRQISAFRDMWENATKAYNVLAEHAGTQAVPRLLHQEMPPTP